MIEVKSELTKAELKKIDNDKENYRKVDPPPAYWLFAIRSGALDSLEKTIDEDAHCCVLSKESRKLLEMPEDELKIWKPLEPWLDNLIASLKR